MSEKKKPDDELAVISSAEKTKRCSKPTHSDLEADTKGVPYCFEKNWCILLQTKNDNCMRSSCWGHAHCNYLNCTKVDGSGYIIFVE